MLHGLGTCLYSASIGLPTLTDDPRITSGSTPNVIQSRSAKLAKLEPGAARSVGLHNWPKVPYSPTLWSRRCRKYTAPASLSGGRGPGHTGTPLNVVDSGVYNVNYETSS